MKDLERAYEECVADGRIISAEDIHEEVARSLYRQAAADWEDTQEFEKAREKRTGNYSRLFSNRYDVMRMLIHVLAILDGIKPGDHKCIAAHICLKHPEYELDWETLETMRLLRNGIQYRGQAITRETWMSCKTRFEIYIRSLMLFVEGKLEK